MCRKTVLRGWCLLCLGLGMILGHCLESWILCCGGGAGLILLGILTAQKR